MLNPNLPSYYQENYLTLFPSYLASYIETPLLKPPMLLIHLPPLLFHYFRRQRPSRLSFPFHTSLKVAQSDSPCAKPVTSNHS